MSANLVHVGAVFALGHWKRLIRIVAADEKEVMYDSWCEETEAWKMQKLRRTVWYLRMPVSILLRDAVFVRTDAYSEAEKLIHRPDLPFSFAQSTLVEWAAGPPGSFIQFARGLSRQDASLDLNVPSLAASALYLSPFGPGGAVKAGSLLHAADGGRFSVPELLWHAAGLQAPHIGKARVISGVGIYRAGVERKLPAYYIWGAKSRAD